PLPRVLNSQSRATQKLSLRNSNGGQRCGCPDHPIGPPAQADRRVTRFVASLPSFRSRRTDASASLATVQIASGPVSLVPSRGSARNGLAPGRLRQSRHHHLSIRGVAVNAPHATRLRPEPRAAVVVHHW